MATADQSESVIEEVLIAASPETVFEYFLDPARMRTWMGGHATLDPRPGGVFEVDIGTNYMRGKFLEVVPAERIVFSWGWLDSTEVPPGSSTVTCTFEKHPAGTLLRLVHAGLSAGEGSRHRQGWVHYLDRLSVAARGGDPGPDPHALASDP